MTEQILNVQGMSCEHCRMAVTRAVSALSGVAGVEVDLAGGTVKVRFDEESVPLDSLRRAIEGEGYEVIA
ncbi:MAG: heavy-metal-associated domain-containing protein [Spirochaetales bacterium]|nr:heavy-metal-associated domain-containing protein [Spirochaetales bacterium]